MPRRDIGDCKSYEELLELWRERAARVRALRESWEETDVELSRLTRPPRDPDERAFLEQHGGLGPFAEKPNPPWAKGWPPRNPDRPLTELERFADAVNAAWREEPLDDGRPESDAAVPRPTTGPDAVDGRAPATRDGAAGSGPAGAP